MPSSPARRHARCFIGALALFTSVASASAQPASAGGSGTVLSAHDQGPAPPPRSWTFGWQDHPSVQFGNLVRLAGRARFQFDARDSDGPYLSTDGTGKIALKRLGVQGTIGRRIDFAIDHELVKDDGWRDVYVNVRLSDGWQIRLGQFKLPLGLDETTSLTTLDFLYRSRVSRQLAPGRDPGVMVWGRGLHQYVRYEAGLFRKDGRNARRPNSTRVQGRATFAGRLRVQPFRAASARFKDLEVGVAMTAGEVSEGLPGLRGRTALDVTYFSSDLPEHGLRRRTGVELRWPFGPFGVKSEYIRLTTAREGLGPGGVDLPATEASGWFLSGAWVVTGERKTAVLMPAKGVHEGGIGAIEVGARVEALRLRVPATPASAGRANRDRATTIGVTWVLNEWLRMQANLMRERLSDPGQISSTTPRSFWTRLVRLQLTL